MMRSEINVLAAHQLAEHLPFGVKCLCAAELADLNADVFDKGANGRALALAVHQAQEIESMAAINTADVLRSTETVMNFAIQTADMAIKQTTPTAEPPRIEDMAPGTMFTEEVRWTVTGTLSTGSTVAHSVSGEMRFADRFDPSTIRDVTPPKDVTA